MHRIRHRSPWTILSVIAMWGTGLAAVIATTPAALDTTYAADAKEKPPMIAHNVYFSLKDPTPENRQKLVAACDKYLSAHPGTVFYAAGTVSPMDREVNDRDWDVGLHVIFQDQAAHDSYQVAELHQKFIDENKATWVKVRVFDTDCAAK